MLNEKVFVRTSEIQSFVTEFNQVNYGLSNQFLDDGQKTTKVVLFQTIQLC